MDTKSLAKSKRAHTLHNKKHHPNQKVKAAPSTVGASSTNKEPVKAAVREKPRPSQGPASLPSNWDRYEGEDDSMTENQTDGQSSSQPSDIVVPKSKGADYTYLISEAKSQSSTRISSEIFPSLDDFVSDFGLGKDTFVAVRGESLLSSIQNDSFFVDDKTRGSSEASFLSLNLHALSEQLAKIDLPKRLFMEADLFPPEQHSERGQEGQISSQDHDNAIRNELQAYTSSTSLKHPTPNSYPKSVAKPSENQSKLKSETADAELDMLLDSFADANLKEKASTEKTVAFDIDGTIRNELQAYTSSSSLKHSTPNSYPKSVAKPSENQSKLKSETADAELDMLLDSFADANLKEKASTEKTVAFDIDGTIRNELQAYTSSSSLKHSTPNSYPKSVAKPSENQSKLKSETADAELDMLLDSFADANLKEKASTEKTVAFDIDGTLDDLLKQTSTPSQLDQKTSHTVKSIPVASKPELLDDFDSWLDTI